jgi:putative redox protein
MQKAIQMSEETYCPVWAMLKGGVEIVPEFKIIAP